MVPRECRAQRPGGGAGALHRRRLPQICAELLCDRPLFFLVNAYTARLSPTVVANLLTELLGARTGAITAGEVGLPIRADGKVLPCGIYGRWEAE